MTQHTHLHHFHGGLKLPHHKQMSTGEPVTQATLPAQLTIPLQQHIGETGKPLVKVGDRVLKGQPLTQPGSYISAPVHAPSSGIVSDIGRYPVPHPSGLSSQCVVIDTDGRDEWISRNPVDDYHQLSIEDIRHRVRQAGIVGLGGAAFPTAVKMNPGPDKPIDTLIINAAECEPYISCDDMLMREYSRELLQGIEIIHYTLKAERCLIAIEDNKPEAISAMESALKQAENKQIEVVIIPAIYPTGGEKQLIKVLTGKEVPSNGLPSDMGIVMQNVGTALAVYKAIMLDEPLISRIVTITGEGVQRPRNLEVLIGTPMSELIAQCGGYHPQVQQLIMGGPMMGFAMPNDNLPVIKACNCLLLENKAPAENSAMPCIRCGECTRVCPASLLPQQLYWYASAKNFDLVQDYHLFDCIECGCCAYVCPSHIPLVQYYRFAKTEIWNQEREKQKSDHARIRHDFRQARLEREKREREERLRKKKEMLAKKKQQEAEKAASGETTEDDPKKAAIAAAMQRVKDKKNQTAQANKDNS